MLEWDELEIAVKVDGNAIHTLSIDSGREFRIEQTLSAGSHTLSIECDRAFVPLEEGLSQDYRKLSVLITGIEMD